MPSSALPALDIGPAFDPFKAVTEVQDFQTNSALAPYKMQDQMNVYNLRKADYGNTMLQQAADEALSADPDQAPAIWDQEMQKLASQNIPGASQFIGRYRPDVAARLKSAFAGGGAGGAGQPSVSSVTAPDPKALQMAVSQVPSDQLAKSVKNLNMAISSFNGVTNQDQWNQEVQTLKNAGIPVDQFINPSADWREQYAQAYKAVQNMTPYRDAMQQRLAAEAAGLNIVPQQELKAYKPGDVLANPITGEIKNTIPGEQAKEPWEFIDATKTGGIPLTHNKATDEWRDPSTNQVVTPPAAAVAASRAGAGVPAPAAQANTAAYGSLTDKVMKSENATGAAGLKSPTSNAAGPGQFMPATWISTVKQNVPGMDKASDAQILAMRTDPRFPGLARDMTNMALQDGASGLQKAGLPVTTATAALTYKLGLPDAEKVIGAKDDNTPLASILSDKVMKANPQYQGKTVGQLRQMMQSQFGNDPLNAPTDQNAPGGASPDAKAAFGGSGSQDFPMDPDSQDILGHTGLSLNPWFVLTGQASKLPRGAERAQAMKQANDWLKKNKGMDLSTFQSEYQANNNSLEYNIARYNQTNIMENEILGTLANIDPVARSALAGRLTPANVALVWAGKQTNDPVVNQYSFLLQQLKSETAGYLAALQGRGTGARGGGGGGNAVLKEYSDEAGQFLMNGISNGGLDGVRNAVLQSTDKMGNVMKNSIDFSRQNIWNLFGVGDQYKARYPKEDAAVNAIKDQARAAGANAPGASVPQIPAAAIQRLKSNPGEKAQFDSVFGAGSADRILGGK